MTQTQGETLDAAALTREIVRRKRPPAILRGLMTALEGIRQAQGLGWSRPWNKYGMTVFSSHVLDPQVDRDVVDAARVLVGEDAFAKGLLDDPALMMFAFYHDRVVGDVQFEGLTLSFGRRLPKDRTRRDRVDIVLEDRWEDGNVDGHVDLARVYINPWSEWKTRAVDLREVDAARLQPLYSDSIAHFQSWKSIPERQWSHWSTEYIDYFGPRTSIPAGSTLR